MVEGGFVGVFWDNACNNGVDSIDWGSLFPGSVKIVNIFARNDGASDVFLFLNTSGWSTAEASDYILLDWDYSGDELDPKEVTSISLILSVSSSIRGITDFSFDILITAKEFYGYLSDLSSLFSDNPLIRIVYPSGSSVKPLERRSALVSDWIASTFYSLKLISPEEGLDTDGRFVDQRTGYPIGGKGTLFISLGGPIVNIPVYYYEVNRIAPVIYCGVPGAQGPGQPWSQWYLSNGTAIMETAFNPDENSDLFLLEFFKDRDGRYVFITYGLGWKGTYAAGKYFDSIIYPNLEMFRMNWIIIRWEDSNGDGFVNNPFDGDTYSIVEVDRLTATEINHAETGRITVDKAPTWFTSLDWRVIYPSDSEPKPFGRVKALLSDWSASAFVTTKLGTYSEGLDTNGNFVDQYTGGAIGAGGMGILSFGGPIVNVPVYYYEVNRIAPVIYCGVPGAQGPGQPWSQWYQANGKAIIEAAMETDEDNDLFLIEWFEDLDGRHVFIAYGLGWRGTYAAGKYFNAVVFPNMEEFSERWIIVKWEDTNGDGFVNAPDDGDEYTLIISGS